MDLTPKHPVASPVEGGIPPFLRLLLVVALIYCFLVAIQMLGGTLKSLGKDQAESLIASWPPLASLAVGILATVLVQSSSVTTATIVGVASTQTGVSLEESIQTFVPMIMGANIGTTITNTLASIGSLTRSKEFERAFAGAVIHDFFNLMTVAIVLPLEIMTGFLTKSAVWLVNLLQLESGVEFKSPIKSAVKFGSGLFNSMVEDIGISKGTTTFAVVIIALAVGLIFICLVFITKNMKALMASKLEIAMNKALEKSGLFGMVIGVAITVAVQSSSITTSILIPMFGAGLLSHRNGFSIMLGANVGTTCTALLAAIVKGPAGLALAFVHLLFNLLGILIFYPIPAMRDLPIKMAQGLAHIAVTRSRWIVLLYVVGCFIVLPLLVIILYR